MALWHSLLLFFLTYGYLYDGVAWSNGRTGGWLMLGNTCYTMVVATVNLKALLECDSWTWVIAFVSIGSIVLWFLTLGVYSVVWPGASSFNGPGADMSGMARIMMSSGSFWLAFLLIPTTTLITDVVLKGIRTTVAPSPRDLACISDKSTKRTNGYFPRSRSQSTRPIATSNLSEPLNGAPETGEPKANDSAIKDQGLHGYAFSQEEGGAMAQTELIRNSDSTLRKPQGL
ncbi:hypothetical protein L596_024079 [Steinernema carpocapsae]|uniref:P-type ATPase C-terminal domain-containing protein n=1 Tax=Steinernema carpocapsae TaxID=34508 RepID=A0A4U5MFN4_STECR|nr:hypothetical protein L596_024079 [Steinernema carpocapsae]